MAKIKSCRMTGLPVKLEDLQNYEADFRAQYDIAEKANLVPYAEGEPRPVPAYNMLNLQQDLAKIEIDLRLKYAIEGEVNLPKTIAGWHKLIVELGSPLMLAPSAADPSKLILVIMDTPIG